MRVIFTSEQLERAEKLLYGIPGATDKAVSNAFNRGLQTAKTEANRQIKQRYAITQGKVAKHSKVTIEKASSNGGDAAIVFAGSKIPLYEYSTNPKNRTYVGEKIVLKFKDGRTHQVFKNKPVATMDAKDSGWKRGTKAFIATMQSGHTGVFEREEQGRFPIKQLYGFSIADMLDYEPAKEAVAEKTAETVDKRLEHEIGRILSQY